MRDDGGGIKITQRVSNLKLSLSPFGGRLENLHLFSDCVDMNKKLRIKMHEFKFTEYSVKYPKLSVRYII